MCYNSARQTSLVEEQRVSQDTEVKTAITGDMTIGQVLREYPQTLRVFLSHGLMCVGCAVARFENIRDGAMAHGIDVDALLKDLNQAVQPDAD
jgi:hybrid cluster-associated redox disulfide protein